MVRLTLLAFVLLPATLFFVTSAEGGKTPAKLPLVYEDNFDKGSASHWEPTDAMAWKLTKTDKGFVYDQFRRSKYNPPVRSPYNRSLIKNVVVTDFVLEAKVKSTCKDYGHRDVCIFFGYQDPSHLYYVHLGKKADPHANQVFIVDAKPRTKISLTTTEGTPWDDAWHQIKVTRQASGPIAVYFDDMNKPAMTANDTTFTWGQVGLGSFDDTAQWDDIKLYGTLKK